MAHIVVEINTRRYQIACDDGQEANLTRLAAYVDKRVRELVAAIGQVGDDRLLVMASLLVADELSDAYTELDALRGTGEGPVEWSEAEDALLANLDALAERIETLARRFEQS